MMAEKTTPQPAPAPAPNGNGWKRQVIGRVIADPVGFLDWAFKVGVSSAIGFYLVVSLTGAMKSYLQIQGEETIKQTRQITEMAIAMKEVSLSQSTIKDMSRAGQEAAKAAQEAASIAGRGMADQKPILERMAESSDKRTSYMVELVRDQKAGISQNNSDHRAVLESETIILKNQGKILDRFDIIMPAKPEPKK